MRIYEISKCTRPTGRLQGQRESIGSTHDNLLSQLWPYESDVRMTKQAASDSRTAGCTLASGTLLA